MVKVIIYLIPLFLFSCGKVSDKATKRMDDPLAKRFEVIEGKLQAFANRHNAKLSTVWSKLQRHDPDGSDSFMVRHIVWKEGLFGKAILIPQHSDSKGIDTTVWDFLNLAWLEDTQVTSKPTYVNNLLTKADFQVIEGNIEQLLRKSETNLSAVRVENLK